MVHPDASRTGTCRARRGPAPSAGQDPRKSVSLGSNDIAASKRFYDAVLGALGASEGVIDERGRLIYMHAGGRLIVTPLLAVTNVALHWWMGGDGPLAEILGNFGPRTTNGEWWRLLTAAFVHTGWFTLALNMIALVQVGLVLERFVGSLTFTAVYAAAAVSSGLVALSASPGTTIVGASGAVFGLYGLLVATWMWGTFQRADARVDLHTIRWCSPVAVVFAGVNLANGGPSAAAQYMGLVSGFVSGVLMARSVWVSKPPVRRVATTVAAGAYLALAAAVPLRGVSDVRPALANVLSVETRTTAIYDGALREFRNGRMERQELAQLIERRILP